MTSDLAMQLALANRIFEDMKKKKTVLVSFFPHDSFIVTRRVAQLSPPAQRGGRETHRAELLQSRGLRPEPSIGQRP